MSHVFLSPLGAGDARALRRLRYALTRRCLAFAVHLDTDEGNAVMLKDATAFELLKKDDAGGFVCIHKEVR